MESTEGNKVQKGLLKKNAPATEKNLKLAADESPSKIVSKDGVDDDAKLPAPDPRMLQEQIEAQNMEISRLLQMLQIFTANESQNIRETKILELSKRNRDLNLMLEKERRSASKWKYELQLLKEECLKRKQREAELGCANDKTAEKEAKECQEWKEKYNQVNAKLMEVMAGRSMLTAEVSKLQHALQREVGDHIPISKVLEESGDWKGRSQQICILKDKILELKAKLKKYSVPEPEYNQNEGLDSIYRKECEHMSANLMACRDELKNTKERLNGVLARRHILENELKVAKEKMAMLIGKSDNDDRLINALRLEVEAQKQGQGPVLYGQKVGGPLSLDLLQRQHRLAASFNELKSHCYQQELQIQAQAELIEYLRAITSSQHEEEGSKGDNYVVSNNSTSDISLTSKSSDISHFDNNKLLEVQ